MMNLDLYPTLFGLAGVGLPGDRVIDGKNIAGVLSGASNASPHDAIYFYHYDLLEGVRAGQWKYFDRMNRYVWPIALDAAPVPDALGKKQMGVRWPLLYDLRNDSGESYNVINTFPEKAAELKATMAKWEKKTAKNPRGFGRG
jgi:arylsulfatase A-like enzyme